jgi:hypothetical protein
MVRRPYAKPEVKSYGDLRQLTQSFLGFKDSGGADSFVGRLLPKENPPPGGGGSSFS